MRVSFTGTRRGMTNWQKEQLRSLLTELRPELFSHGCCSGADIEAHAIVREVLGKQTFVAVFPSTAKTKAPVPSDANFVAAPRPALNRHADIVDVGRDLLIAAPLSIFEVQRSGTWHTVRVARSMKVSVKILKPIK